MDWRVKQEIRLIVIGCLMLVVSGIVLALDQTTSTELLGSLGALGGVAIILNAVVALARNGNGQK